MTLSPQFKSAFKLALALILAYWIALSMDWAKPYWAGIAIVACSLSTAGESIQKGLLRLGGTFLGILVAIALMATFPQDRWLFIGTLSLWLSFCCYQMFGTSRWYFWMTAGFVVPILVIGGGGNPVNDFAVVVLRAQQTVLGILCFSLVYSILWPSSSQESFENAVQDALALQRRLLKASLCSLDGTKSQEDLPKLRMQIAELHISLDGLLEAATLDSYSVWERRRVWQKFLYDMEWMSRELQRLLLNVHDLDVQTESTEVDLLSNALIEVDLRISDVQKTLFNGVQRSEMPHPDLSKIEHCRAVTGHFRRAALAVAAQNITHALAVGQSMVRSVSDIRDQQKPQLSTDLGDSGYDRDDGPVFLDPDMWTALIRIQIVFLGAVACSIYIPGFPNPVLVICIGVSIAFNIAFKPQVSMSTALVVSTALMTVVSAVHIMLLPTLTAFWQLATLLFVATFCIAYCTTDPKLAVMRSMALNLLLVGLQIDNQQEYNFLFFAVMVLGLFCVLAIIELSRYYPVSLRPEKRVEALIKRFFASAEFVVRHSPKYDETNQDWMRRLLLRHHLSEVDRLPSKLVPWLSALPDAALVGTEKRDAFMIAASLEAVSSRILEFVDARRLQQAAPIAAQSGDNLRQMRLAVADVTSNLVIDPGQVDAVKLEARLNAGIKSLETSVEKTLDAVPNDELEAKDFEHMYRILGAYRGLAEGIVGYTRRATTINWPLLREARF